MREPVQGLLRPAPPCGLEGGLLWGERGRITHRDPGQEMMATSQPAASLITGNGVNLRLKNDQFEAFSYILLIDIQHWIHLTYAA